MVYWTGISSRIHASLDGVLKIELLGTNFLGLRLFITLSPPVGKPLRTWTNRIHRFRWVYTFSTKKWNLDVAFLNIHWTDFWIAECLEFFICSLTENFPLLMLTGPCRKAKITEIRSFLTPITAKSNSTILHRDTRKNKLQRTLKKTPGTPDLSNAHGFPCSVCSGVFVFIIRAVFPWASVRCWSFATSLSHWNISKLGYLTLHSCLKMQRS